MTTTNTQWQKTAAITIIIITKEWDVKQGYH
jgi:hypothetical protein